MSCGRARCDPQGRGHARTASDAACRRGPRPLRRSVPPLRRPRPGGCLDSRPAPGDCLRPPSTCARRTRPSRSSSTCPASITDRVRVLIKDGVVLLVGEKLPPDPAGRADATFHLVERGFGRFARAVRLSGAVDAGRARARLPVRRAAHRDPEDRRAPRPGASRCRSRSRPARSGGSPARAAPRLMNILFIGDVFGRPGRDLVRSGLAAARPCALRHRLRHRQRRERRCRLRDHARDRRGARCASAST